MGGMDSHCGADARACRLWGLCDPASTSSTTTVANTSSTTGPPHVIDNGLEPDYYDQVQFLTQLGLMPKL
jgi:hypothetical protein